MPANLAPGRPSRPVLALALAALVAACSGGGGSSTPGGPPPIDPNNPADVLYAQGLVAYNAANQAVTDARTADPTLASSTAQDLLATAEADYVTAQGFFDLLTSTYPTSIRYDYAGYYAGRSSYEIGTIDPASVPTSYLDARDRLDLIAHQRPLSSIGDKISYFEGRARFHLAALPAPLDTWAAARADFQRSLAVSPAGTFADNAQYYLGRTWFEEGFALANVTPSLTWADASYVPARTDFDAAEIELWKLPGTSTYYDNAQYYLGVSYSMEPEVDSTLRVANLDAAVLAFGRSLAAAPSGTFAPGAHYWRGKAHYDLAFQLSSGGVKNQLEIQAAIDDFKAVPPTSIHYDNALYGLAKSYVWFDPAPLCTTGTGPEPNDATGAVAALDALVATDARFTGSNYPTLAAGYITTIHPPNTTACIYP